MALPDQGATLSPWLDLDGKGEDPTPSGTRRAIAQTPSIISVSSASLAKSRSRARLQTRRATRLRATLSAPDDRFCVHLDDEMRRTARSVGLSVVRSISRASASHRVHGWSALPGPLLDRHQRDWVSCGGALTGHLSAYGRVSVRVVSESVALPWRDERRAMRVSSGRPMTSISPLRRTSPLVWSRDVAISVAGTDCVLAHSVTPLLASRGAWQAMRRLRTRPLAELLYNDSRVLRSLLVSRYLSSRARRDPLHGLLARAGHAVPRDALVARRSVFERHGAPLLITECFLPAFWAMLHRYAAEEQRTC